MKRIERSILIFIILLPVLLFSQIGNFNADNVYRDIEYLSITIGPRPMGSAGERNALNWAVEKFTAFGADTVFLMPYTEGKKRDGSVITNSGCAVGIFKGDTDSTIVIGGHIDSSGREVPGANDNASGTATVMELARLWSRRSRRYTLIFAAFGGEEQGLIGSKNFTEQFADIDKVVFMMSLDMTGADDKIAVTYEMKEKQTPIRFVRDAFALDRELGINRLCYNTHVQTINQIGERGSGSDHMSFIEMDIPALSFTVGYNNSPIHTPQDRIELIKKPMLEKYGRLVDGLLTKYQREGIPAIPVRRVMLWHLAGMSIGIPHVVIVFFIFLALFFGLTAWLAGRKNRMRIEKTKRIRFSGTKFMIMMTISIAFSRLGKGLMQLLTGLKQPGVVPVWSYLILSLLCGLAGFWLALQFTRKWRFSSDPYVYTKRILWILLLLTVFCALINPRFGFYPALALFATVLAVFAPHPIVSIPATLAAPIPITLLLINEQYPSTVRMMARYSGMSDTPFLGTVIKFLFILLLVVLYIPVLYLLGYHLIRHPLLKRPVKIFRQPVTGLIILVICTGFSLSLKSRSSYDRTWKPGIRVDAEYDIHTEESLIRLISSEYLTGVTVTADTLTKMIRKKTNRDELLVPFTADWFGVAGNEWLTKGGRDTVSIEWLIESGRPWHHLTLTVETDTAEIEDVISVQPVTHKKNRIVIHWLYDPTEKQTVTACFTIAPGASVIRNISAVYAEMPIPVQVTSPLATVRYRTTVTQTDTLELYYDE